MVSTFLCEVYFSLFLSLFTVYNQFSVAPVDVWSVQCYDFSNSSGCAIQKFHDSYVTLSGGCTSKMLPLCSWKRLFDFLRHFHMPDPAHRITRNESLITAPSKEAGQIPPYCIHIRNRTFPALLKHCQIESDIIRTDVAQPFIQSRYQLYNTVCILLNRAVCTVFQSFAGSI